MFLPACVFNPFDLLSSNICTVRTLKSCPCVSLCFAGRQRQLGVVLRVHQARPKVFELQVGKDLSGLSLACNSLPINPLLCSYFLPPVLPRLLPVGSFSTFSDPDCVSGVVLLGQVMLMLCKYSLDCPVHTAQIRYIGYYVLCICPHQGVK